MEKNRVRKRALNACTRCRQQKIKCKGGFPCEQCDKRGVNCISDESSQKVLVTRSFINNLERRVASYEQGGSSHPRSITPAVDSDHVENPPDFHDDGGSNGHLGDTNHPGRDSSVADIQPSRESGSRQTSSDTGLMNPLALDASTYVPDKNGRPIYLGTSSNWSFGRRVLVMAHERAMGSPLLPDDLLYPGKAYDLGWDGQRMGYRSPTMDSAILPTPDYAIYLINAVKFHCGQMFHLFDEESFMEQFTRFHEPSTDKSTLSPLWYVHYLLILAFGKAFLARSSRRTGPPGAELFVHAMKLLPDVTFWSGDPVETIEVLCCAAVYFHSLDFRSSAYQLIGQALRLALEHGMHTDMQSQHIQQPVVERSRKIWWTVYVLDRQLCSLMGVPSTMRDEDISAEPPSYPNSTQKAMALDIQVKLSRVIAQISNTVYGAEGRLDKRYLSSTKAALSNIATVTDQLHEYFELFNNGSMDGVSRLAAYLNLLHHQCIVLATRPLLYQFLEARLDSRCIGKRQHDSVQPLLQMCVESAFQMLKVLDGLQEQGLLESFLWFDLDATFTSAIVLIMASKIDVSLTGSDALWSRRAYGILNEMISRGNLVAKFVISELQQLEAMLSSIPQRRRLGANSQPNDKTNSQTGLNGRQTTWSFSGISQVDSLQPFVMDHSMNEQDWQYTMTTEQLMTVADSLNPDVFDWLSVYPPSLSDQADVFTATV